MEPSVAADVGYIAKPNGLGTLATTDSPRRFTVVGQSDAYVGERVWVVGRTTGSHTGFADKTRTSFKKTWKGRYHKVLCTDVGDYNSLGDDSGGPVFLWESSPPDTPEYRITLVGVNFARNDVYDHAFFSPMSGIQRDLGSLRGSRARVSRRRRRRRWMGAPLRARSTADHLLKLLRNEDSMNKKHLATLLVILLPLLAACGGDQLARPGLEVEIRDARTGAPAAYGATMIVRDGSYAETVRGQEFISAEHKDRMEFLWAAENRPGTYDVTITHPEYQTWHREGIRVEESGDNNPFDSSPLPETVNLVAELQPLDGG